MRAVLAGGSGFLGKALTARLTANGWTVTVLTRRPRADVAAEVAWTPDGTVGPWAAALDGAEAIVNLAGAGIADQRWSPARKEVLRESRVRATRSLVLASERHAAQAVFISGSGVGFYGARGDEPLAEDAPPGADFLSGLVGDWEREAERAAAFTRTVIVRTGIVLHAAGGALAQMLPPFKLGIGGPLASGRQYMSWIHLDDWVRMIDWMANEPRASGVFNATAPTPVTNHELTRTLGRVLRRPAVIPVPTLALRALYGELANSLVTGQRALPVHAERLGFEFRFRQLEPALRDLL
ncbi:MAG: TIGR01777 family oxidoreductase [Vicinamibacterales bacterium]